MDGVDILTLSIGPDTPPEDTMTFLNVFDIFMLFARRAGVFVVQAAGNQGPGPSTVVSFSPWAVGVAASSTDRSYPSTLVLGNGQRFDGVGLSGPTLGNGLLRYKPVLAKDAVKVNGTFRRTAWYVEECQFAEALDPLVVQGSVVICIFSTGFFNGNSTLAGTMVDNLGEPIMVEGYDIGNLYLSTHFDFGVGFISPNHAIDPGLVMASGFEDCIRR